MLIADAAPLIFLAKIHQLSLITSSLDVEILIPSVVEQEVLGPRTPPTEARLLRDFLFQCNVIDLDNPDIYAEALSFADNCVLTLAHRERAGMVLSDDRLVRRVSAMEGFQTIGTLGILIRAQRKSLLSKEEAMGLVDQLVAEHKFRIGPLVYAAVRKEILGSQRNCR
jgi:predicted nucleic acid-binding protein